MITWLLFYFGSYHRRRIYTGTKAKVVASDRGGRQNLVNSLPRNSYFASVALQEKDEFNLFFQINRGKTATAARNWINSAPPNRRDDLCLCFCTNSSSIVLMMSTWWLCWHLAVWSGTALQTVPKPGPAWKFAVLHEEKNATFKQKSYFLF